MAVVIELRVAGSRDQHDAADAKVEEALGELGGPPDGLMFHLSWPDDEGFVMIDVWRSEQEARQFFDSVVRPAMTALGLDAGVPTVRPVWGTARPPA